MNHWRILAGIVCAWFFASSATAQPAAYPVSEKKSSPPLSLFASWPAKNDCPVEELENLFSAEEKCCMRLGHGAIRISGKIIRRVNQNAYVQTLTIRLDDFPEGFFTISRIRTESGSREFAGRILSPSYDDALILVHQNRKYSLLKTEKKWLMTE